jgi:ribosomal protein L19E
MNPTDEQRRMVKSLAAVGTPHVKIASMVGIRSDKTLRKHFREELDHGSVEANANVARKLYEMAISGQYPGATIFWLKCRAGWKEKPTFEPGAIAPPPFIIAREGGVQPS